MKARKKGYRSEHELEGTLKDLGLEAKRIPMSGQATLSGDILLILKGKKNIIEVKAWGRGFPEYDMLKKNDMVFKRTIRNGFKGEWLVTMTLDKFMEVVMV